MAFYFILKKNWSKGVFLSKFTTLTLYEKQNETKCTIGFLTNFGHAGTVNIQTQNGNLSMLYAKHFRVTSLIGLLKLTEEDG
jgi:hypothetical protein